MKDIDFDELDKAVSSLMGKTEETPTPAPVSVSEPEVLQTTSDTTSEDVPVKPDLKPVSPQPAPAARRGRFMDVMSSGPARKPLAAPSRTGMSITPPAETSVASTEPEPVVPVVEPEVPSVETVDMEPTVDTKSDSDNWPDPLDMHTPEQTDDSSTEEKIEETPTNEEPVEDTLVEPVVKAEEPEVSLESPFIADAKVEKRPLGGEPNMPEASEEATPEPEETEAPVEEPVAEAAKPESVDVPAELSGDVVHVEADHPMEEDDSPRDKEESEAKSSPAVTSISQQYKEQASTGDQDHTAIYDVANYSEPLAHPAKKKASWLWIVWILLLLALGVGGAITLYLMGVI